MNSLKSLSRRQFLKRSLASSALTTAGSVGINLSLANHVLAQSTSRFDDYKALVCVFLYGGNDSLNMLVPTESVAYSTYNSVRQNLAYPLSDLLSVTPASTTEFAQGMPSAMQPVQQLFEQKKLAIVANTGPLLQPVTKSQIFQNESLLPEQLFSHNDQQNQWQMGAPKGSSLTGWAGRMADLIMDSTNPLPLNMSIDGTNLWQTGFSTNAFSLNATGPETFEALDPMYEWNQRRAQAFSQILAQTDHLLEKKYRDLINGAATNNTLVSAALESAPDHADVYPDNNYLANQLKMVASLASVQQPLQQPRQIFFVGFGGWDTHDSQAALHPQLLSQLSVALEAFNADLEHLGLSDQITTFTLSDFGRTLTSNGDGTDHGWGGHQMVMGGAVNGGDIFGQLPALELESDDDLTGGRMIPTISVEQYAATLAKWFGLSESELNAVFPNLNRFATSDLGFMT